MTTPLSLDQSAFMVTYTGRKFYLYNPKSEDVDIRDIAHALSMLCRFTGHTSRFYSVAQHSWHVSYCVPKGFALEALLHDAAEAYVNDLSRPLKHNPHMREYVNTEKAIDWCVRHKFGLPYNQSTCVKDVDNQLVVTEARALMKNCTWAEGHKGVDLVLPHWSPAEAEQGFLSRYNSLTFSKE
jgi:hypothetical protein